MIYIGIVAAVCAAEALIRHWIRKNLSPDEIRERPGLPVRLHRYHNSGMAENRLQERPGLVKGLGVAAVAILTLIFFLTLPLKGKNGVKAGLALLLGGGLANLLERFLHGHVTDYVQFQVPMPRIRRLIFNLADFCILIGGVLAVFSEILSIEG